MCSPTLRNNKAIILFFLFSMVAKGNKYLLLIWAFKVVNNQNEKYIREPN